MKDERRARRTLEVAEQVNAMLAAHGIKAAVIGAMALAAHRYPRDTEDFDFGTATNALSEFPILLHALRRAGLRAEYREPDAMDSLGGVIDVTGDDFDTIQIVNFIDMLAPTTSMLGVEAIREAREDLDEHRKFRIVDLPHLIALKLDSGRFEDEHDVAALLRRNRPLDLAPIRDVCGRHGLGPALEKILSALGPEIGA